MGKVAICFAGLPRLLPETVPLWQRFIRDTGADVFIHTWVDDDQERNPLYQRMYHLFSPMQMLVEKKKKFNTHRFTERIWPHRSQPSNVLSMWYSVQRSINLCMGFQDAKVFDYDIICRARFDWWCPNLTVSKRDGLTVPDDPGLSGHHFTYQGTHHIGHNDQFGYGDRSVMGEYSKTFERIPWLYSDDGVDFCSELFLTANMISKNIAVTFQTGLNYRIAK